MTLAHPLTEPGSLGTPPYSIALAAVVLVAAVAMLAPIRPAGEHTAEDGFDDVDRPLRPLQWVTRALALLALVFCVYAGRRGNPDGLSNIAPPLVVGVGWASLVVLALVVPRLWAWLDPWDTGARALERLAGAAPTPLAEPEPAADPELEVDSEPAPDPELATDPQPADFDVSVWPAAIVAFAVMHFLIVRADSTQPRTIGLALAAYTIAAVALGVAAGRRLLARCEVFGLTARWAGELRRGLGARWSVPDGAEVVLGVIAGGLLLDLARRAGAYLEVLDLVGVSAGAAIGERALLMSFLVVCAVTSGVLRLAEHVARSRGLRGAVAVVVLPVVLALVVVGKLRRLLVSLQLLPIVAGDPLGRGWDLLGTRDWLIDANPFGTNAQRWAAIAAMTFGGVVGAAALRRRGGARVARGAAAGAGLALVAAAVLALAIAT